ncbi:amidase [Actinokineospora bangkokensis]|uniref:Amidase n=1 Tax=Actinokineospora bangkokensis TaxID=1193682 RepID=A0A1Q9LF67_9PSEU|nr:amidase [Actinokineospora bangkokensis]OLR90681.1 amidase [Actinokineospora bangkokensis]
MVVAPPARFAGLVATAQALADGAVTSVELVDRALAEVEDTQPTLNAFRVVRAERARAEAAAADERLRAGERAPLLGVPLAIKDDVDIEGAPTAFGCAGEFPVRTADCELVRLLKAAGAVIVGKTNTPEFGQWPITEGTAFGVTRNPWRLDHSPGGSSGGSAAAVAAGVVPAAVGSDGAGSVRIPAAWTNLVGVKPTRGRLSPLPEVELFHGITTSGVLARTVADAALLLDVLADTGTRFQRAAATPPRRLRVALSLRPAFTGVRVRLDPQVRAAVVRLARVLTGLGHEVLVADPAYGLIGLNFLPRSLGGLHDWHGRVPDPLLLDPRTRDNGRMGGLLRGRALGAARATLGLFQRRVGRVFERADVVLTPTTAEQPLPVGGIDGLTGWQTDQRIIKACPYAWPWNVLGWPGVNVPAGLTDEFLPVGGQLLGPADSEDMLLSLAAELEGVERWHERTPPRA